MFPWKCIWKNHLAAYNWTGTRHYVPVKYPVVWGIERSLTLVTHSHLIFHFVILYQHGTPFFIWLCFSWLTCLKNILWLDMNILSAPLFSGLFSFFSSLQDVKVPSQILSIISLLFFLYFCLWWDLINSLLVKCLCVDVTDPSLFMFTKISIDSGHGVASLSSSSLTQAVPRIYSFFHKCFCFTTQIAFVLWLWSSSLKRSS